MIEDERRGVMVSWAGARVILGEVGIDYQDYYWWVSTINTPTCFMVGDIFRNKGNFNITGYKKSKENKKNNIKWLCSWSIKQYAPPTQLFNGLYLI